MKFFDSVHTYQSDWETVTSAFWVKYPNTLQPHVKSIDTVNREIDAENQILKVRRVITLSYDLPGWIERIIGRKLEGLATEEATVDLKTRKLTIVGQNHSCSEYFGVRETCTYEPHPENPSWTQYEQKSSYTIRGLGSISGLLESHAVKTAKSKGQNGLNAMSEIIEKLESKDWRNQVPGHIPTFHIPTCACEDNKRPMKTNQINEDAYDPSSSFRRLPQDW